MVSRGMKDMNNDVKITLKNTVMELKNILRMKLGKDRPVDVEPMNIEFEGATRPIKVSQTTC